MLNCYRANFRQPPRSPNGQDAALSRGIARLSAELCDQGRLVKFEEATHWVQHEEADKINKALEDFLER